MADETEKDKQQNIICGFCAKKAADVRAIIQGPTTNICNECVVLCVDVLIGRGTPFRINAKPHCTEKTDEPKT